MALKSFKPYTKSVRGTVLVDKSNLWKGNSYKPLTVGQHSTGARNNLGRITSRHRGGDISINTELLIFIDQKEISKE
jgi:large subunit ribosomal protein L2